MTSNCALARILLVEDQWLLAMDVATQLEDEGYLVVGPAASLNEAMDLIVSEQIDAALLDIDLARTTSYPAALALRRRGVPFAFLTGKCRKDFPPNFGDQALISKPVTPQLLRSTVKDLMGGT